MIQRKTLSNVAIIGMSATLIGGFVIAVVDERASLSHNAGAAASYVPAVSPRQPGTEATPLVVHRTQGESIHVLFAGDSLTYGAHASTPDKSFTGRIETALKENGNLEVTKIGGSGMTAVETIPEAEEAPTDAAIAFVELGTNDVLAEDTRNFQKQYANLLDTIQKQSPAAALACTGPWSKPSSKAGQISNAIRTECVKRGGRFVNLASIRNDQTLAAEGTQLPDGTIADGSHPNDRGHALIADALLKVVRVN